MNLDKAREILEDIGFNPKVKMRSNEIFLGMGLIIKSLNNADVETEWCSTMEATVYYGEFEASVKEMSEREVHIMGQLGWEEEEGCWSHHI